MSDDAKENALVQRMAGMLASMQLAMVAHRSTDAEVKAAVRI